MIHQYSGLSIFLVNKMSVYNLPPELLTQLLDQLPFRDLRQFCLVSSTLRDFCRAYQSFWAEKLHQLIGIKAINPRDWYHYLTTLTREDWLPLLILALQQNEFPLARYLRQELDPELLTQLDQPQELAKKLQERIEENIDSAIRTGDPLRYLLPYTKLPWRLDQGAEGQAGRDYYLDIILEEGVENNLDFIRHLLEVEAVDSEGIRIPGQPEPTVHQIVLEAGLVEDSLDPLIQLLKEGLIVEPDDRLIGLLKRIESSSLKPITKSFDQLLEDLMKAYQKARPEEFPAWVGRLNRVLGRSET